MSETECRNCHLTISWDVKARYIELLRNSRRSNSTNLGTSTLATYNPQAQTVREHNPHNNYYCS